MMRTLALRKQALAPHRRESKAEGIERTIVGYTTREHLILDLDKTHNLFATEKLIRMIQAEYRDVGDCLISESSNDGFHCIFDDRLSWSRIMQISRTLTGLGVVNRNFTKVRSFREDLTLRITSIDRGLERSEAPRPTVILCKWPLIEPYKWIFRTPTFVNPLKVYAEKADVSFSGIYEYLTCLSAFRQICEIPLR